MTDKPNVLTLSVLEWRGLTLDRIKHLADGIQQMYGHLEKQSVITKQMIGELNGFWGKVMGDMAVGWDHVQLPLQGWEKHSRPIIAEHEEQQKLAQQPSPPEPIFDGPHGRTDLSL